LLNYHADRPADKGTNIISLAEVILALQVNALYIGYAVLDTR